MRNIVYLDGKGCQADKEKIENFIKESENPVFVLDCAGESAEKYMKLCTYIDLLHDDFELKNSMLYRLRICREIKWGQNVVTLATDKGEKLYNPECMGELLKQITPGQKYHLIIENDERALLANIIQQLIYIDYPITEIDAKLRCEYKDAAKTELFMKHIEELCEKANRAIDSLKELPIPSEADNSVELYETRAEALTAYEQIREQIKKAKDVEMKLAVAASKKTGKSVIANCMFGMELAPTSLELATPNSCIYRRSQDSRFHLTYKDKTEDYDCAEQVYKRVQGEFKAAQEMTEDKYGIPDMDIEYVSNGNNFESYTIYDTPGPDAAGTKHEESAKKAIEECDVAIFAIDYSKYLTDTEVAYLKKVKDIFEEKHKFHTLVFVINKMDLALKDKGTKSRIKSIDFIRNRLREIDSRYGECVIFATSAQDYFWTLELQAAAHRNENIASLLTPEADLYTEIRPIQKKLRDDENADDDLINVLSNISSEVDQVENQLRYQTVSLKTLQDYSGIPQMMSYVSYIAKSKARNEIVNSITYMIDSQYRKLQAIIDKIANIELLMGKTQTEIDQISAILEEYIEDVEYILSHDLTEEDNKCIKSKGMLESQIKKYQEIKKRQFPVNLAEMLEDAQSDIAKVDKDNVRDALFEEYTKILKVKIKNCEKQIVPVSSLDVKESELRERVKAYITREVNSRKGESQKNVEDIAGELIKIASNRMERLNARTKECQNQLAKNDCNLLLPTIPDFSISIPIPNINYDLGSLKQLDLTGHICDVYKQIGSARQWLRNVFLHGGNSLEEVKVKKLSDEELQEVINNNVHKAFYDSFNSSGIYELLRTALEELSTNVDAVKTGTLNQFDMANQTFHETIETFQGSIDDRERYEKQMEDYERMKTLVSQIKTASEEFMDVWTQVLSGVE